jgi:hypothetical protein
MNIEVGSTGLQLNSFLKVVSVRGYKNGNWGSESSGEKKQNINPVRSRMAVSQQ